MTDQNEQKVCMEIGIGLDENDVPYGVNITLTSGETELCGSIALSDLPELIDSSRGAAAQIALARLTAIIANKETTND